jgi:DNA polymerase-3 subunit gamma/tau
VIGLGVGEQHAAAYAEHPACELVDPAVLSLVVRAGRGSVRDSMSVLDQLLAGAGKDGVTYQGAAGLLGFTPANLVDDTVSAFAAGDGAAVFTVVDSVVDAGHDPRRFAEDLLERLRDLIIIQAVPDSAGSILSHLPADELDRMRQQAAHFGPAELSRAADVVNAGLTEMRGATAPRLQLELICARVLLPGADTAERGLAARLDRLERRLSIVNESAPAPVAAASDRRTAGARPESRAARPEPTVPPAEPAPPAAGDRPSPPQDETPPASAAQVGAEPAAVPEPAHGADAVPGSAGASSGGIDLITLRRHWPDVLAALAKLKRSTWTLVSVNSQVRGVDGDQLTLGFTTKGLRDTFASASQHQDYLREALIQVLGVEWKIEAIVDPSSGGAAPVEAAPAAGPAPREEPAQPSAREQAMAVAAAEAKVADEPPGPADLPSVDDPDADDSGLSSHELLERELGAKVIGEYDAT